MTVFEKNRSVWGTLALSLALASGALCGAAALARPQFAQILAPGPPLGAGPQSSFPILQGPNGPRLSKKQRQAILKMNYQKMRKQAATLAELSKSLQKEIDRSNVNVLSITVIEKAKKIQKLAKSIQNTARGY